VPEIKLPPGCKEAVTDFWKANSGPIPTPEHHRLVSFIDRHPKGGSIHKKWGYHKLVHFLRDIQAAGLLWNRLMADGQYDLVPVPRHALSDPGHVFYWQALGFSAYKAKQYALQAREKQWGAGNDAVGKLSCTSPRFDPDLHAKWFYDSVGEESWWVRNEQKECKAKGGRERPGFNARRTSESGRGEEDPSPAASNRGTAGGGAGRSETAPLSTNSPKPPPNGLAEAIADYWEDTNQTPVQHPYSLLVKFLDQHPKCGGYKSLGYKKLFDLLTDAEAAGLVCLRPGKVRNNLTGQPHPEIAPGPEAHVTPGVSASRPTPNLEVVPTTA